MSTNAQFPVVFEELRKLLQPYAARLTITADSPGHFHLYAEYHPKYKKAIYFGGVEINKSYVSFHLIPVYAFPDLLQTASPELKRRMQGKSCFNFKAVDGAVFGELGELTRRGFERFQPEYMPAG